MVKENKDKRNSILIKIYLFILFVIGIILGFSYLSANKEKLTLIDIQLDNNLVTALAASGIEQQNIITQFTKEIKSNNGIVYNQYYKKIKLARNQKLENFEPIFKTLTRNFKISLSRTKNNDDSYIYKFYDKKRVYSIVELTK